jgi:hypothetical protein
MAAEFDELLNNGIVVPDFNGLDFQDAQTNCSSRAKSGEMAQALCNHYLVTGSRSAYSDGLALPE